MNNDKQTRWSRKGHRTDRMVVRMTPTTKSRLQWLAMVLAPKRHKIDLSDIEKRDRDLDFGLAGYDWRNFVASSADVIDYLVNKAANYAEKRKLGDKKTAQHMIDLEELIDYHDEKLNLLWKEQKLIREAATAEELEELAQLKRDLF